MGAIMPLLESRFRVVAPDSVGGFGLTDAYAPAPYGLQSRVDHMHDVVEALSLERFTILGNSQGAWCAAKYAMLHPDRVERMILIATNTIARAMGLKAEATPGLKLLDGYDGTRAGMAALMGGLIFNKHLITDELIDSRQASATRPGAKEAFERQAAGTKYLQSDPAMSMNFSMLTALPALTKIIPTIMIWGEEDIFAEPALGRRLEALLPDVKFHWIPKAGHQVQTDQPRAVADLVCAASQGSYLTDSSHGSSA
jgi:pimeloyl-ACP methyl ester carboxylesterase